MSLLCYIVMSIAEV